MKDWTDQKLWDATVALADEERRISVEIIRHLQEIRRRRLYAARGFSTMWMFLTKELKLSEPATQQRLAVMRAIVEEPSVESLLETGKISFSNVAEASRVSRIAKKPVKDLIPMVTGITFREAKAKLSALLPPGRH